VAEWSVNEHNATVAGWIAATRLPSIGHRYSHDAGLPKRDKRLIVQHGDAWDNHRRKGKRVERGVKDTVSSSEQDIPSDKCTRARVVAAVSLGTEDEGNG